MMQSTNTVVQMIKQDQLNAYNREISLLEVEIEQLNGSTYKDDVLYKQMLVERREKINFKILHHELKNPPK